MGSEATILRLDDANQPELSVLDQIVRDGARKLLQQAIEAEVAEYIEQHKHLRDANNRQAIVRNGVMPSREISTAAGRLEITQPRVRDRRSATDRERFSSTILPRYARRSASLEVLLPVLYLKGISTGDMQQALTAILGNSAPGLSSATIMRLTEQWQTEHQQWSQRDLSQKRYVYFWADGIYTNVRLSADRSCLLVIIGATAEGHKELVAVVDGVRESSESWKSLLLDLRSRGLSAAPQLAVADGALGFWKALEEVYPSTAQQLCWVHKTANVLNALPKKLQQQAKGHLREIYMSATRSDAEAAFRKFASVYGGKYPKAVATIEKNLDRLLSFYAMPAEHWQHIRTTNVIESAFATVRHRQRQTKGNGSAKAAVAMIYKLAREAEKSWRRLHGHEAIIHVLNGARYVDGERVDHEQPTMNDQQKVAA